MAENMYEVIYRCPKCSHEKSISMEAGGLWEKHGWPNMSIAERICDICRIKTPGNEGVMGPINVITIKK